MSAILVSLSCTGYSEEEPIQKCVAAIEKGDLKTVKKLLADGLDPNTRVPRSRLGYTPLFLAVQGSQLPIMRELLTAGADPAIEDENGDPVMVHAAHKDRIETARLLIKHGVSIDSRNHSDLTALLRGAPYDKGPDIQAMIDLGANPDLTDPDGNTALMLATGSSNLPAVKVLIKAGAKLDLLNKEGKSALMLAFDRSYSGEETDTARDVVKSMVDSGANINLRDPNARTPLMLAINGWNVKNVSIEALLVAKPDVLLRDGAGRDALFLATQRSERKPLLERLLELGADIRTKDNDGTDLLMLAAGNHDLEQVSYFLKHGLSPDAKNKKGSSAVHHAAGFGRWESNPVVAESASEQLVEVIKRLHQHGGSLTDADADGDTPLHLAATRTNPAIAVYLLSEGLDPRVTNLDGETPLHLAARYGSGKVVELLIPKYPDVDVRDNEGFTPLMHSGGDRDGFLQLLKAGADVNATNKNGDSALAFAIEESQFDNARFLIKHGADPKSIHHSDTGFLRAARLFQDQPMPSEDYGLLVSLLAELADDINVRDADGMTALMWVAASDNATALKSVLARGPDLQARSPDGRTAMMWAASARAASSIKLMREGGADDSLKDSTGRTADDWLKWPNGKTPTTDSKSTAATPSLRERLDRSRKAALRDYLTAGKWLESDRIAGTSPLHLAASLGDTDAIAALLKLGAPPDQTIGDQSTPLMEAAANGQLKTVRFLLARGADPALRNADQNRAIDLAVGLGHRDLARFLLHREHSLTADESALLVILVNRHEKQLLKEFLKAGASIPPPDRRRKKDDCCGAKTLDFSALLVAAAIHQDPEMLRILSDFPPATGADDPDYLTTALHQAADEGRLTNVIYLVEKLKADPDILQDSSGGVSLMSSGEPDPVGKKPVDGFSALSRALESGHEDVVRYLVGKGAIVTGRTRDGSPPLGYAVEHHLVEMLEFLLKNKSPTGLAGFGGENALHLAAALDDEVAVRLLLTHGADPGAKTNTGQTALDIAREKHADKAAALLDAPAK